MASVDKVISLNRPLKYALLSLVKDHEYSRAQELEVAKELLCVHVVYMWRHRTRRGGSECVDQNPAVDARATFFALTGQYLTAFKGHTWKGGVEQDEKVTVLALLPNLQVGTEAKFAETLQANAPASSSKANVWLHLKSNSKREKIR